MTTKLDCKKSIVDWIKENKGYIYAQFSFLPETDNEEIPLPDDFEAMFHDVDSWEEVDLAVLNKDEAEKYPGANFRRKFYFTPLKDNVIAHTFENENDVLYVIVHT